MAVMETEAQMVMMKMIRWRRRLRWRRRWRWRRWRRVHVFYSGV